MADKTKLAGLLCPKDVEPEGELIHNIILKDLPLPTESEYPRYVSIHRECILEEERRKKRQAHQTFGVAEVRVPKPSEYLKKNGGVPRPKPEFEKHDHTPAKRVPIPKAGSLKKAKADGEGGELESRRGIRCPCAKRQGKDGDTKVPCSDRKDDLSRRNKENYIAKNILNAVRGIPRQPVPRYIDTRKGTRHLVEPSGLIPKYRHKPEYGLFPEYHRKECLAKEQKVLIEADKQNAIPTVTRYITKFEKKKLIESFKEKWAEVQGQFQQLPFVLDTMPKITRRIYLENKLKEFEDDIRQLEETEYILVIPDEVFDTLL